MVLGRLARELDVSVFQVGQVNVAKTGPGYAVLSNREEIPAGDAVLLMRIDGREHRWEIVLDNDILPFDDEFSYRVTKYPERNRCFRLDAAPVRLASMAPTHSLGFAQG